MRIRRGPSVAVVMGVGVLAACGPSGPPPPVDGGAVPWTPQALTWVPCPELGARLECTSFEVPIDPTTLQGRVRLHATRAPALDRANRIGTLFVNPGGPGAAGSSLVAELAADARNPKLAHRFDLVGVDWRGTGRTQPAFTCATNEEFERLRTLGPNDQARAEAVFAGWVSRCLESAGPALVDRSDTVAAAWDLEWMRQSLGDAQVSFYVASFGTRLAAAYVDLFPDRVRAAVLDAPVPPRFTHFDLVRGQGRGFEQAFDRFAQYCATSPQCRFGVGRDAGSAVGAGYDALLERVAASPVPVGARQLTFADLEELTEALLAGGAWTELGTTLADVEQGTATRALALADLSSGRQADGGYQRTSEANVLIHCADQFGPPAGTEAEYRANLATLGEFPRFKRRGTSALACFGRSWPQPRFEVTPTRAPPLLVVGSKRDPRTLFEWAEQMTSALGNGSYLLESNHEGHVAYFSNDVSNHRIRDYLISPSELPPTAWSCANQPVAELLAVPQLTARVAVTLQPAPAAPVPVVVQVVEAPTGRVLEEQMVQSGAAASFVLQTQGRAQDVVFRASAQGYRPTEVRPARPLTVGFGTTASLVTDAEMMRLYPSIAADPALGLLRFSVLDCDGVPAEGAAMVLDPPGVGVSHGRFSPTQGRCLQLPANTTTDRQCGSAVMTGVPLGQVTPLLVPPGRPAIPLRAFQVRSGETYQVVATP